MELVENIYKVTANLPKEEQYGLSEQLRRAAISIPSNISEESARNTPKEILNFLNISLGSIAEVETQLLISEMLGYVDVKPSLKKLVRVRALILGLRNSIRREYT